MQCPSAFSLIPLLLLAIGAPTDASDEARTLTDFEADILVTVIHAGAPLAGAVVKLDLDNNGIWEEHEPQVVTGEDGATAFYDVVSIHDPGQGGDEPADIIDWRPSRILTGNLRGMVGARDAQFDFVLPAGADEAALALHDLRGRRLAGTDGRGDLVLDVPAGLAAGVYFVRLSAAPAAPVTYRITSVGQRTLTVRARQVSLNEAIAAGWVEPRAPAGERKSREDGHTITILVAHDSHGGMAQQEIITAGLNEFTVVMPESPTGFVHIPSGRFMMGSPDDEPLRENSETRHRVTLTQAFYMSTFAVTEQQWYEVMGGTPTTSQLPRQNVSWDMAAQFCNALSSLQGLNAAYTIHGPNGDVTWNQGANGYRLATEAEWEYACRATSTRAYHNNTNCLSSDSEANFYGGFSQMPGCPTGVYRGARTPVGSFPANSWGLYDMHGNVYEWTWCGWRTFTSSPVVDPVTSVGVGANRMFRGGDWDSVARYARSAGRYNGLPGSTLGNTGFRVVRTVF